MEADVIGQLRLLDTTDDCGNSATGQNCGFVEILDERASRVTVRLKHVGGLFSSDTQKQAMATVS